MKQEFLLDPEVVFLNHGSFGACPREVFSVFQAWQREMERNPVQFLGRRSTELLRQARQSLGGYLGARSDDLVFVPNATSGVNVVARSLPLQPGDEVLTTDLEYGACDATWAHVGRERGSVVRRVAVPLPFDAASFADRMLEAVTPRTRVLFVSHVASTTALILPLQDLVRRARERGLLTLIDGAHAPGLIDLDLDELGADFYTGNCHKWLCAPKGAAFLHARPEHHASLHASVISWGYAAGDGGHAGFDAYTGSTVLERRLQWQGTRDLAAFLTVPAALDWVREHHGPALREACHRRAMALMHRCAQRFELPCIGADSDFAQMAPLPVPPCDPEALRRRLFDHHHIEVPVTQHGGRSFVRVSVQSYTTDADLQALEQALAIEFEHPPGGTSAC